MTIIATPFTKEKEFIFLRNKIIDPVTGINAHIGTINTYAQATDTDAYGVIIQMKPVILPDPNVPEHGAVFTLVPGEYAINYDPFITLTLEAGSITTDGSGTGIKTQLSPTIYINFVDPADGTADILMFRYLQAFESLIENTRWSDPFPRRIKELEPVSYQLPNDNKSWREIGLKIMSDFATR